jgi:hypothetical protein
MILQFDDRSRGLLPGGGPLFVREGPPMATDNNDPSSIVIHQPRQSLRGLNERDLLAYFQDRARYNGGMGEPGQDHCIFADGEYLVAPDLARLLVAFRDWVRSEDADEADLGSAAA